MTDDADDSEEVEPEYAEYTVRVRSDGVRSPHDKLVRKAQSATRAKKWSGDAVESDGDDDGVSDLLAYLTHRESR